MTDRSFGIYALDAAAVADTLGRMIESERHRLGDVTVIGADLEGDPVALVISPDGSGMLIDGAPQRDQLASNWSGEDFVADAEAPSR